MGLEGGGPAAVVTLLAVRISGSDADALPELSEDAAADC